MKIQGSIVAIVTPFDERDEVDVVALRGLVDMHLSEGTHGIVCCGTTGESPTLSEEEQELVLREVIGRVKGKIPVIAGVFSNCTKQTKRMARKAKECGADAILVIVPYFNRPGFEGVKRHVDEVAEVGMPIIFYNHPSRTALRLSAEQLIELSEHPMIYAMKEGSCDLDIFTQVINFCDKPILSGDDVLAVSQMGAGAKGVISIVANVIPRLWSNFLQTCLDNDIVKGRSLYVQVAGLCQAMILETNPQCVKYALSLMGKCRADLRLPMFVPSEKTQLAIREEMEKLNLLQLCSPLS